MARNSRSEAIAKRKCRSIVGVQDNGNSQGHPSGKPLGRRAQVHRSAALNAELVTAHVAGGGW